MIRELVAAVIGSQQGYLDNLGEAEEFSQENGLRVADMPSAIEFMSVFPEMQEEIRKNDLGTTSSEYYGWNRKKGSSGRERLYQALHGAGSVTSKGLQDAFYDKRTVGFQGKVNIFGFTSFFTDMLIIPEDELASYVDDIPQIHLYDAQKGDVPKAGTPYAIYANPKKDFKYGDLNEPELNYDKFMRNNRALMVSGGPEQRELLAGMLFRTQKNGGGGLDLTDNLRTNFLPYELIFPNLSMDGGAIGNPVYLGKGNDGPRFNLPSVPLVKPYSGDAYLSDFPLSARFLAVEKNFTGREENSDYSVTREDSAYFTLEKLV